MKTKIGPISNISIFRALMLLAVVSLTSCESTLFIELEESEKLIVLNGAISNDSLLTVQVSRTRHILDNAPLVPLENATVMLYREGSLVTQMVHTERGYYSAADYRPENGVTYTIEAENSGYRGVSATTTVPGAVDIVSVDTATVTIQESQPGYWSPDMSWFTFDLTLNDPAGERNYYLVETWINTSTRQWRDTTVIIVDSIWYGNQWNYFPKDSVYPVFDVIRYGGQRPFHCNDIIMEAYTSAGALFSDQLIDGKTYSFRGQIDEYSIRSADSAVVELRLHSISEPYYKYLKTRQKHFETKNNYLAVPVIVYSNVESGTGFFGGYSTDVHTITTFIPEYDGYWYY
jgi:hypothetical protein